MQQRVMAAAIAVLFLAACEGGEVQDVSGADPAEAVSSSSQEASEDTASTSREPANERELLAAVAFNPPWVEQDARQDGAELWAYDVEVFPHDAGFGERDGAAAADVTARGLVATGNRQFLLVGADSDSGTDDSYASIIIADFGTQAQAQAAVEAAATSALGREDGALALDGIPGGGQGVAWSYSIAQCTPNGLEVDCVDEPPWATYHVLAAVRQYTVFAHVQWADGTDQGPDEAIEVVEQLVENFG